MTRKNTERGHLYPRLALEAMRKNSAAYGPFLLAVAGASAGFYMLATASYIQTADFDVRLIMRLCQVVLAVVCAGFLLYADGILMRQRGRELGLYAVLGMTRGSLARLLAWETLYTALAGLGGGLAAGVVLDRLLLLALCRLTGGQLTGPAVYGGCLVRTALVFGAILLLCYAVNAGRVGIQRPVDLIKSGNVGDREPKTRWLLAIVGAMCLAAGYLVSILVQDPLQALALFFVAVLLVIAGTFLLFLAGSVAVLKLLRRCRGYYYRPAHFISVSGLLHRMGRNAAGMSVICVLSTAVLVLVSSTVSLYASLAVQREEGFPRDVLCEWAAERAVDWDETMDRALAAAEQAGYHPENARRFSYVQTNTAPGGDLAFVLDESGYAALTGRTVTVPEGMALMTRYGAVYVADQGQGKRFEPMCAGLLPPDDEAAAYFNRSYFQADERTNHVLVVPDGDLWQVAGQIWDRDGAPAPNRLEVRRCLQFDLPPGEDTALCALTVGQSVQDMTLGTEWAGAFRENIRDADSMLAGQRSVYGGLLFLGLFLGTLFLGGVTLIVYYKQLSEGYEDRARFAVMAQVGLDRALARRAIRSQILLVFFLPLGMALCHLAAAVPMIVTLLRMYDMRETGLYILCALCTAGGFAAVYTVIYLFTARIYTRLVRR